LPIRLLRRIPRGGLYGFKFKAHVRYGLVGHVLSPGSRQMNTDCLAMARQSLAGHALCKTANAAVSFPILSAMSD